LRCRATSGWTTSSITSPSSATSWKLLRNKSGATRLGFAVLLKYVGWRGRFPTGSHELPDDAVAHLARQVRVPTGELASYDFASRTAQRHRTEIRAYAYRQGDTLVVTKLDRLARSLPDARDIVEELTAREVKLSLAGSVHDPSDPVGRLLFNVLAMVVEFEADLIRMRTRGGMKLAKAKGRLRGKKPKLSASQESHLVKLHAAGEHTTTELAGAP